MGERGLSRAVVNLNFGRFFCTTRNKGFYIVIKCNHYIGKHICALLSSSRRQSNSFGSCAVHVCMRCCRVVGRVHRCIERCVARASIYQWSEFLACGTTRSPRARSVTSGSVALLCDVHLSATPLSRRPSRDICGFCTEALISRFRLRHAPARRYVQKAA